MADEQKVTTTVDEKGVALVLTFSNSAGHHVSLRPKVFDRNLTLARLVPIMDELTTLAHLFVKKDTTKENSPEVQLYTKFQSAKYTKTITEVIK